ncbi:MmgE/PrpD family protein [Niallia sp. 03133]|uniref:MmgE/PrpD family protein n=1 Tax=Niallia sp. 03133 TaxID=3458060 RepID=UPI004044D5EF
MDNHTLNLAKYVEELDYDSIPTEVIKKTKELFIDWVACCYAGTHSEVTSIIKNVTDSLGKGNGADVLGYGETDSAFIASLINGSASHAVELDDVHNASVFHPGATVIPAALAVAQDKNLSGKDLIVAIIAGYEISTRLGECLGLSHYEYFHTTATAGVIGAAVAASCLLGHKQTDIAGAIGNAGTLSGGLWQFLEDDAMSKQLHTGRAAADGVLSAYLTDGGLIGPKRILEGERGLCKAMSKNPDWSKLEFNPSGKSYKVMEVSLKPYSCCRHIHPGIDGVITIMKKHAISKEDISSIKIYLYSNGYELLSNVEPTSSYTAKFCIPYCISHAAISGEVTPSMFEDSALSNKEIRSFMPCVEFYPSEEMDTLYPAVRASKVEIYTKNEEVYTEVIYYPKGDPENPLTIQELQHKFISLSSSKLKEDEAHHLFHRCMELEEMDDMSHLFKGLSINAGAAIS